MAVDPQDEEEQAPEARLSRGQAYAVVAVVSHLPVIALLLGRLPGR